MITEKKNKKKKVCSSTTFTSGDINYNIDMFNKHTDTGTVGSEACGEGGGLSEQVITEKRETKRYYARPQNQFAANKADVLKILVDAANNDIDCCIYSLKSLDDHDNVGALTTNDIIYYYDKKVLYDKNKIPVVDYDLFIKHEEERPNLGKNPDKVTKSEFHQYYDDRINKETITEDYENLDESINPFNLDFESYGAGGYRLTESGEKVDDCCICGEPINGYGNNAEPYARGTCCDACNMHFVIPARLNMYGTEE